MKDQAETTAKRKEGRGVWTYVYWVGGILLLYVLSFGPYVRTWETGRFPWHDAGQRFLLIVYKPLSWAYVNTPIHKPIGMYLHLWAPKMFDKNGDE